MDYSEEGSFVDKDWAPHESHKMGPWESTSLILSSTMRFGSVRKCPVCGGWDAQTSSARKAADELFKKCS